MIYVPGVAHRKNEESHTSGIYAQFEEVRQNPVASSTHSQRVQDEALSRSLSASIIRAMRTHNPPLKVHSIGNPVRSEIRKSGGKSYLPTVLRNTAIPTKVLVEVANMNNPQDRQHLANPEWRQWFAESFVDALISHYNK
jgi:N-acetylmuramoyl-L-alanine amidase